MCIRDRFGTVHPIAPHYNTLLRMDPTDRTGTRPVPDLAESWTISPDGMTYTLKLRQGVRFHDGSPMTSRDVKASYDKIIFPPAGIISARKGTYQTVEAVEAPDPSTVRFRLKWPEASFLVNLASPYSWIYKADILAKDIRWYETNVMGTGPFKFVEHVKGSHWVGKKNPDYWDKGKPYLDSFRALFISSSSAQVAAIRSERAHIQFRGFAPADRDTLVQTLGAKRLLREAGVPDGFAFTFKNRGVPPPYEPVAIWLIDQWRQIGLNVKMEMIEASAYHPMLKRGDFEVAMDFQCGFIVEPDLDLPRFLSTSDANYGRHKDTVIDDLFSRQGRATDPEERRKLLRQIEKRLLDDEAHVIYTLQWHRIIPHLAKVKGWTITPSHYLNNQLDTVWLSEDSIDKERARIGLTQPLWRQFTTWILGVVRLDFGTSMWTGAPIWEEVRLRFALSMQVAIMATIVSVLLAIPLGVLAALKQDTWNCLLYTSD